MFFLGKRMLQNGGENVFRHLAFRLVFRCACHVMTLSGERHLLFQFRCVNLNVLSQFLLVALHDEGVRMVGFRCGFEEIGRVVFQCIHPRLQIGDVVLVELAFQIGALDTEVCGKEQASKHGSLTVRSFWWTGEFSGGMPSISSALKTFQ